MKTIEYQGLLTTPSAMGRSVPVKSPSRFTIVNEIKGFTHNSYGMALVCFHDSGRLNLRHRLFQSWLPL